MYGQDLLGSRAYIPVSIYITIRSRHATDSSPLMVIQRISTQPTRLRSSNTRKQSPEDPGLCTGAQCTRNKLPAILTHCNLHQSRTSSSTGVSSLRERHATPASPCARGGRRRAFSPLLRRHGSLAVSHHLAVCRAAATHTRPLPAVGRRTSRHARLAMRGGGGAHL